MDSAVDRFVNRILLLAPGPDAVLHLHSAAGAERTGTLTPGLPDALAEAARTGRSQRACFRDLDGGEREVWVFPAPALPGQALAVEAGLEECILAPAVENLVNQIAHDVRNHAFTIGLQAEMGARPSRRDLRAQGLLRRCSAPRRHPQALPRRLLLYGRPMSPRPTSAGVAALVRLQIQSLTRPWKPDAPPLYVSVEIAGPTGAVRGTRA